jgi:putative serine protease PepD
MRQSGQGHEAHGDSGQPLPRQTDEVEEGAPARRRISRRGIVTLGGIFGLPLAMYLIAVAVNLSLPCGPDYASALIQRSLVQIAVGSGDDITPIGTGFAVSGEGHVLTSRGMVTNGATGEPASRILVRLPDGLVVQAHLVGSDEQLNLALVKVDGALDLRPAKWGDAGSCVAGQPLVAAGFSLSGDGRFADRPTYATGKLSAVRDLGGATYLEHAAEVSPGLRGGPLITMCGEVVGVNAHPNAVDAASGVSVAVASSTAEATVREWLGR